MATPVTRISIAHCERVTDEGLRGVAAGCPGLTELHADYCTKITDAGIVALVEGCNDLQVRALLEVTCTKSIVWGSKC